jgi:hypothetical protein
MKGMTGARACVSKNYFDLYGHVFQLINSLDEASDQAVLPAQL